ncbi:hypothetical protein HYY74_07820 [Candidatus Woesearchaeota archaeon]|nr:hypothetical protein [Candidatus Woesearchaeota archaeon]
MARRAETLVPETTIRLVVTAAFIILLWLLFRILAPVWQPDPNRTFDVVVEAAGLVADNEPFERQLSLDSRFLYGFLAGEKHILVDGSRQIAKPDEPSCNAGACLCVCSEGCSRREERYCRSARDVSSFMADSSLAGLNRGSEKSKGLFYVALDGGKERIFCIRGVRSGSSVYFSRCSY